MINIDEAMWDVWENGDFTGPNAPTTRATISKHIVHKETDDSGKLMPWRSILFDQDKTETFYEIPNIQTCSIDRRIGTDAASFSLSFINQITPSAFENLDENYQGGTESPTRRELGDLGEPGYYTFRRGLATDDGQTNPWKHDVNEIFSDMFIPNRLVMIYQGYGTDGSADPAQDANLVRTGIFLIDQVDYGADGTVTLQGRDLSKLLIEQRVYPPIVPKNKYPVKFWYDYTETDWETNITTNSVTVNVPESLSKNQATHPSPSQCAKSGWDSGNTPWYSYNASVYGHQPEDAFDGSNATWWLSMGNNGPNEVWSYEWVEAYTGGQPINKLRFKPKWGGYKCWIAVYEDGAWQGTDTVPYGYWSGPAYPNDSNVKYVKFINVPNNENWVEVDLPRTYNARNIRLIFSNLVNSGLGSNPYRAAIYNFHAYLYTPASSTTTQETIEEDVEVTTFVEGNIKDYTDIVKIFAAWGGFYWPYGPSDISLERWRPGTPGRVWGDFFYSGAYPVDPPQLDPTLWDNKSLMDAINQIREILGFFFFIDETGGIVWRPPNIWRTGNYITGQGYVGADSVRVADEEKVLINYNTVLNDQSLRSEIVVVATDQVTDDQGETNTIVYSGSYRPGHAAGETIATAEGEVLDDVALLAGQERVALVADYPFASQEEVDKFAFLVGLWAHWTYRSSKFRIPGNPAFMPDDQIRIYERVTSETYIHYIEGISSSMDMNAGTWFMDIDTHWLGNGPDKAWMTTYSEMSPALYAYLDSIDQIPGEAEAPDSILTGEYEYPDIPTDPIRVDVDVDALVPLPPELIWPDYASGPDVIQDPITPPDPATGGGSYYACSNKAKFALWSDTGPRCSRPCSCKCDDSKMTTYTFMHRWLSAYDSAPELAPPNTHNLQTSDRLVRTDVRAKQAYLLLAQIMAEEGLRVDYSGGYNCRGIRLRSGNTSCETWSNHAWGLAVDINPGSYPFGTPLNSSQSQYAKMRKVIDRAQSEILSKKTGQPVMRNGVNWSYPDPMHFEICVSPADLAAGVQLWTPSGGGGGYGGFVPN